MARAAISYNDTFAEKWVAYLSPDAWRENVSIDFLEVPFTSLQPAGCHTDPDVVDGWFALLQREKPVAPFVVTATPQGTFYIHDGNHRYEALWAYLGESAADTMVRVALVVPNDGFHFAPVPIDKQVVTYELRASGHGQAAVVGLPLLATAVAVVTTMLLPGTDQSPFFVLMVAAVIVSARFGGLMAGIIAVLCNTFAAAYFMLPPLHSVAIADQVHAVQLLVSALVMTIVVLSMQWKARFIPVRFWKGSRRR
jgi:hypothetical protein